MTKNIPGSRRKRRSKRLQQMKDQEVTVMFGRRGDRGQFETHTEDRGLLRYADLPEGASGDRGYIFDGSINKGRLYIRNIEKVDYQSKLIRYLTN